MASLFKAVMKKARLTHHELKRIPASIGLQQY